MNLTNQLKEDKKVSIPKIGHPKQKLPPKPYKFLDYFEENDSGIFFGRDYDSEILLGLIQTYPICVLYGESGTGKTSIIKASLIPELKI